MVDQRGQFVCQRLSAISLTASGGGIARGGGSETSGKGLDGLTPAGLDLAPGQSGRCLDQPEHHSPDQGEDQTERYQQEDAHGGGDLHCPGPPDHLHAARIALQGENGDDDRRQGEQNQGGADHGFGA